MNSDRRADLQRKLSMGSVPRPPAGLAERIKNDIPKYLQAEQERERFSRSVAFSMRVAASIILLITSVFVTLNLIEPASSPALRGANAHLAPSATRSNLESKTATMADNAPAEEIRLDMTELAQEKKAAPQAASSLQAEGRIQGAGAPASPTVETHARSNESDRELAVAPPPAPMQPMLVPADEVAVTAQAPAVDNRDYAPEPRPTAMAAAAPAPAPAAAAQPRREERAAASGFMLKEAIADDLDLAPRKNVFGIAVDPKAFSRIKTSLENGERPDRGSVDIEALVNYFAGAPAKPPRQGVRLEVEASPAPVEAEGDHAVLRFTIDTPASETRADESIPPAARDAHITVNFNRDAVATFHRVGDGNPIVSESILLSNVSVTGLFELELRPHLKSTQRIATVSLQYRSVNDGRVHKVEQMIYGRDLAHDWAHASRRHRLASLGAIWGESLKGSSPGVDVVRRAEELVTQNPKDPLARELAHAANASGGER